MAVPTYNPAPWRLWQDHFASEASLGYMTRPFLGNKQTKKSHGGKTSDANKIFKDMDKDNVFKS